jgi:ribosomal protein S18 acetylase RimI-like enzyme
MPASSVSLEEYAEAFTAGFAEYFLPVTMDAATFARKVRVEQCDLRHSLIAYDGDRRAGMAVLAIRGDSGWCGGFGVVPELRGRGVGRLLMEALLESARAARLRRLTLEVLSQNVAARRLYEAVGMRVVREMFVLERAAAQGALPRAGAALEDAPREELLPHFARLHRIAPAWQRDLPTLLSGRSRGLRLGPRERPRAYALVSEPVEGFDYLIDLAAEDAAAARELSAGLARVEGALRAVNEPEGSLFVASLVEHGFDASFRQHEMLIEL